MKSWRDFFMMFNFIAVFGMILVAAGPFHDEPGGNIDLAGTHTWTGVNTHTANIVLSGGTADITGVDTFIGNTLITNTLRVDKVSLTNSAIKAARATAMPIAGAAGSGRTSIFVGMLMRLNFGSNVLTESDDNLQVKYVNGSGDAISGTVEATGFIDAAADSYAYVTGSDFSGLTLAESTNVAMVLHNTGDGEWAGNASNDTTMTIWVIRRILL